MKDPIQSLKDGPLTALPIMPKPNEDGLYTYSQLYAYGIACVFSQRNADLASVQGQDIPPPITTDYTTT